MSRTARTAKLLELLHAELAVKNVQPKQKNLKQILQQQQGSSRRRKSKPVRGETAVNRAASAFFLKGEHKLRTAHHHDLAPDALIIDPAINTLGLVVDLVGDEYCGGEPSEDETDGIAEQAAEWISKSTYLRHLLLNDPTLAMEDGTGRNRLAWFVELVFVLPHPSAPGAERKLADLGEKLHRLIWETDFFLSVGVNLLPLDSAGLPQKPQIRRAFAWLLRDTRTWFEENPFRSRRCLEEVTLENYRVPGKRTLSLSQDPNSEGSTEKDSDRERVHLLHGWNGSGKSSIAEGLELVVTGSIQRLRRSHSQNKDFYRDVILHRSPNGDAVKDPATVLLKFKDGDSREAVIGKRLRSLHKKMEVTSFRLDQPFMDKLTVQPARERARIFLQSFVPEEHALLDELEQLQQQMQLARQEVQRRAEQFHRTVSDPDSSSALRDPAKLVRRFGWLGEGTQKAPDLAALLGLPLQDLHKLKPFRPEIDKPIEILEKISQGPPTDTEMRRMRQQLGKLGEALDDLEASEIEATLDVASGAVELLHSWQPQRGFVEGTYAEILNRWLRLCALCELAQSLERLYATFRDARSTQWEPEGELEFFLELQAPQAVAWEETRQQRSDLEEERVQLLNHLLNWDKQPAAQKGEVSGEPLRLVNDREVRALNLSGNWLGLDRLGTTIQEAMSSGETPELGRDLVMGAPDWSSGLESKIQELREGLDTLRVLSAQDGSFVERLERMTTGYQSLKESFDRSRRLEKEQEKKESKLEGRFVRSLSDNKELRNALNELMTLLTPARWAYEPLKLNYDEEDGTRNLRLLSPDDVDATLRLNTAELNVFTVALFLLCSVKAENPLSLLIFDDPLQNMDELTVTTLARGLARVLMTHKSDCRLLMMFHGEDQLDRFSQEIPALIHRIPWLSPSPECQLPIETEALLSWERQDLSEMIEILPMPHESEES